MSSDLHHVALQTKNVVVLGDSNIVGTPLAALLRNKGASSVTVCHRIALSRVFDPPPVAGHAIAPAARPERTTEAAADNPAHEEEAVLRASVDACLPRLPGPMGTGVDIEDPDAEQSALQTGAAEQTAAADSLDPKKATSGHTHVEVSSVVNDDGVRTIQIEVRHGEVVQLHTPLSQHIGP